MATLDELRFLAGHGHPHKLFWWQVGEVLEIIQQLEAAVERLDDIHHTGFMGEVPVEALVFVFVVLKGVRGRAGVQFLGQYLLAQLPLLLTTTEAAFEAVMPGLLAAYAAEGARRGDHGFGQHKEGLHAMHSGDHFLAALTRENFCATVQVLTPFFKDILGGIPFTDESLAALLTAAQGVFPLATQRGKVRFASTYTAMDVGRVIFLWATNTSFTWRLPSCSLGPRSFAVFLAGQCRRERDYLKECGLGSAETFGRFVTSVSRISRPTTAPPWPTDTPVSWATTIVSRTLRLVCRQRCVLPSRGYYPLCR